MFQSGITKRTLVFLENNNIQSPNPEQSIWAKNKFLRTALSNKTPPPAFKLDPEQNLIIRSEIQKLLKKGIIEKVFPLKEQFVANIFSKLKANGNRRLILDLTELNESVAYAKFKMENFQTALA